MFDMHLDQLFGAALLFFLVLGGKITKKHLQYTKQVKMTKTLFQPAFGYVQHPKNARNTQHIWDNPICLKIKFFFTKHMSVPLTITYGDICMPILKTSARADAKKDPCMFLVFCLDLLYVTNSKLFWIYPHCIGTTPLTRLYGMESLSTVVQKFHVILDQSIAIIKTVDYT